MKRLCFVGMMLAATVAFGQKTKPLGPKDLDPHYCEKYPSAPRCQPAQKGRQQATPKKRKHHSSSALFNSKEEMENSCTCSHEGQEYSKGSHMCVNHDEYECGCGGWFKDGSSC